MKELVAVQGPRDLSIVSITIHVAHCAHRYHTDRAIFEDESKPHEERERAFQSMCKNLELLNNWKAIRADVLEKGGLPERKIV